MILKSLKLINFRGYKDVEIHFSPNLNVIIGRNDIGKSTILEALSIFFDSGVVSIEQNDLYVHASENSITIEVSFTIDPTKKYLIDEDKRTSLKDEYLINGEDTLTLRKVWDCSKKIGASSLKTYIVAQYLSAYKENPLVAEKLPTLKKIAENAGIIDNIVDKRACSDFRMGLYDALEDKTLTETIIQIDKEDSKKLYASICKDLPSYELFQSDRANKDTDKQIQDPLKVIVRRSIDQIREKLDEIQKQIVEGAVAIGQKTIDKLKEMDSGIADSLQPEMKAKPWDSLFSFTFNGDEGIPLNKRGSGVRRLIMLNFFRADAEEKETSKNGIIYSIEEPETSQHPDFQIMLIDALTKIANTDNKQVIMTTHSPEIAKICHSENLIFIKKTKDGLPSLVLDDETKMKDICDTLGIMPMMSRLVISVEGENDVNFIMNINQNVPELRDIINLQKEDISIIPLQGGNLTKWINRNYFRNSNVKTFLICDSDKGTSQEDIHKDDIERLKARGNGSDGVTTTKREMENYISKDIYETEFPNVDFSSIKDWDVEDLPTFIVNKTKSGTEKTNIQENIIKQKINGSLSKKITKSSLDDINAFEEVKTWFEKINNMYLDK